MNCKVIDFARSELVRYLDLIGVKAQIELGLFEDFGVQMSVEDRVRDDAIVIRVKDRCGFIAGANERSVLIGVYRLLREWGIGWVRPGRLGEHIPKSSKTPDIDICETASRRNRCICIEGAVSIENVLDMIDWLPKVGMNMYSIQFSLPKVFFERWYTHEKNPFKPHEPLSDEAVVEMRDRMEIEAKRRGLLLSTMGHGWTCFPFGVSDAGWYETEPEDLPKGYIDLCALVNGKRELTEKIPLYTQLCYSNPYVVDKIVNAVVEYAETHPQSDIINFSLGDMYNNHCECDECKKSRVSDKVVRMVNLALDKIIEKGLPHRIGISMYYNTCHPPLYEKIKYPDRIRHSIAPITRSYAEGLPNGFTITEVPEYELNKFNLSFGKGSSVAENLAYLHEWRKVFSGDVSITEYYLMWDHILDAGGEGVARLIYEDMKTYDAFGLSGQSSIQLHRNAFPSSIAMTVLARGLWDKTADYDAVRRELYAHTFGEDMVDAMCEYFETLSRAFKIGAIRNIEPFDKDEFRENMKVAIAAMEAFGEVIEKNLNRPDPCQRESWKYLVHHRHAYTLIGKAILLILDGNRKDGNALRDEAANYIFLHEDETQPVLDSLYFRDITDWRITIDREAKFSGI